MPDKVPADVSQARFSKMTEVQDAISLKRNARFVGRHVRALCEDVSKTNSSRLTARCDSPRPIHFEGDVSLIGQYTELEITGSDKYNLYGKLI